MYNCFMKKLLIVTLLILIGIQFIRMDVPSDVPTEAKLAVEVPEEVQAVLKRACFSCHSNNVVFPWYSSIAPVSWFTKMHVKEGREHMNFSTWQSYDEEKQLKFLEKIPKAIKSKMPLPSYLLIHKEAVLSDKDKELLSKWATDTAFDLE